MIGAKSQRDAKLPAGGAEVEYNAVVGFADDVDLEDDERVDGVLGALRGLGPAIGWTDGRAPHVTVTVDVGSLFEATQLALERVEEAVGAPAARVEVLPTVEFDAR